MNSQDFKNLLHNRSLKATSSRIQLLEQMEAYKSAMPYSAIQKVMKSIDRVTLYRTLESLKDKGIIHIAYQGKDDTHYAICSHQCDTDHHHHDHVHFKCVDCEAVTCEEPSNVVKISIPKHEIHKVSIYVEGVCSLCSQ